MPNDRATSGTEFAGWRIMRSDAGRFWASRERPFPPAAEQAGACRTVDADDLRELCQAIAEQESLAEVVPHARSAGTHLLGLAALGVMEIPPASPA
ncbi:hypothetical protein [Microbispora sp. NPDC046933]|uniref:hypothetical protein n=1 Tax=Microbispora sp. NPDC046933 TaxID=3155618 RepID=UPI00340D0185